jgi:dihydrofolate reductase
MRKLVYTTSLSLDGYIDAAAGDPSWLVPDEELHRHFNDIEREIDSLLYGRRMYELMAGYWPTADQDPSAPAVIIEDASARGWPGAGPLHGLTGMTAPNSAQRPGRGTDLECLTHACVGPWFILCAAG